MVNEFSNISHSKYTNEFLGEGEDVSSTSTVNTDACINNPPSLRKSKTTLIKKTSSVVNALNKLALIEQTHFLSSFDWRLNAEKTQFQCHRCDCSFLQQSKADCDDENINSTENEVKVARELRPFGPFLSCPVRHGRSQDFEKFPQLFNSREKSERNFLSYGRPNSAPARPQNIIHQSTRCRYCTPCTTTQSSLFSDPEDFHLSYKLKITYGKIPQSHKQRVKDRYKAWISLENLENTIRPGSANKMHPAFPRYSRQRPVDVSLNSAHNNQSSNNQIIYGPEAIRAIASANGGYNYKQPVKTPRSLGNVTKVKTCLNPKMPTVIKETADKDYQITNKFPWPSDNARFYDDDSDPRITDLLVKSPFTKPTNNNSQLASINACNPSTSQFFGDSEIVKPVSKHHTFDYVVGPSTGNKDKTSATIFRNNTENTKTSLTPPINSPRGTSAINFKAPQPTARRSYLTSARSNLESSIKTSLADKAISTKTIPNSVRQSPTMITSLSTLTQTTMNVTTEKKRSTRRFKQTIRTAPLPTPTSKSKYIFTT